MEQDSSRALFKPAKTQRASEAIYNQIYPKIVSGELQPGDRLPPERELAEMFQRSRPVVRRRCGCSSRTACWISPWAAPEAPWSGAFR